MSESSELRNECEPRLTYNEIRQGIMSSYFDSCVSTVRNWPAKFDKQLQLNTILWNWSEGTSLPVEKWMAATSLAVLGFDCGKKYRKLCRMVRIENTKGLRSDRAFLRKLPPPEGIDFQQDLILIGDSFVVEHPLAELDQTKPRVPESESDQWLNTDTMKRPSHFETSKTVLLDALYDDCWAALRRGDKLHDKDAALLHINSERNSIERSQPEELVESIIFLVLAVDCEEPFRATCQSRFQTVRESPSLERELDQLSPAERAELDHYLKVVEHFKAG